MKKTLTLLAMFVASTSSIFSQTEKATIAVSKIETTSALSADMKAKGTTHSMERIVQSLSENLTSAIQATRKFSVLSRSDLDAVIKEQSLVASGNSSEGKVAAVGKLKGAKYIVSVLVDDFQDYLEKDTFAKLGKKVESRKISIGIIAKIVDTTSAEVVESSDMKVSMSANADNDTSTKIEGGTSSDALLGLVARDLSKKVAIKLVDVAFPAKIIAKTGKIATFNRNEAMGTSVGDEYEIFAQGEEMFDPGTGDKLGFEEISVGKLKVISVNPNFSRGTILEDHGVEKGQTIRLIKKANPQHPPATDANEI